MGLNQKQTAFVEEYLTCWNSAEAARRAGYSEKTARSIGSENLTKPDIKAAIEARLAELKMSADEVLVRLTKIGRANIADFAHVSSGNDLRELGDSAAVVKKFKRKITRDNKTETEYEELELELYPADVNLERLGRHLGLFDGAGSSEDKPLIVKVIKGMPEV